MCRHVFARDIYTQHHTGQPFSLPTSGLDPIPASGRHFCLEEEAQLVLVKGGHIKEIKVGGGPAQQNTGFRTGSYLHSGMIWPTCRRPLVVASVTCLESWMIQAVKGG